MAHRELLVTLISAQDLKNVRFSGRAMSPYAKVSIRNSAATKMQTSVASRGGTNPSWNCGVRFSCEEDLFRSGGAVTIELRNRGSFSDRLIGTVTVPLADLSLQCRAADSHASRECTLMSYQVRTWSGKAHGVLNLAVLVGALVKQPGYSKSSSAHSSVRPYPASATYLAELTQAATHSSVFRYAHSNPQLYPPQQVSLPQQNAYAVQQNLYPPQYQPQHAQPAAYNYQQAAY